MLPLRELKAFFLLLVTPELSIGIKTGRLSLNTVRENLRPHQLGLLSRLSILAIFSFIPRINGRTISFWISYKEKSLYRVLKMIPKPHLWNKVKILNLSNSLCHSTINSTTTAVWKSVHTLKTSKIDRKKVRLNHLLVLIIQGKETRNMLKSEGLEKEARRKTMNQSIKGTLEIFWMISLTKSKRISRCNRNLNSNLLRIQRSSQKVQLEIYLTVSCQISRSRESQKISLKPNSPNK
jgi:hypothetical protein